MNQSRFSVSVSTLKNNNNVCYRRQKSGPNSKSGPGDWVSPEGLVAMTKDGDRGFPLGGNSNVTRDDLCYLEVNPILTYKPKESMDALSVPSPTSANREPKVGHEGRMPVDVLASSSAEPATIAIIQS
ncbi:hypothetical protein WN51_08149 [Melipona quadrifasciata]|uniref:Uncharacterized protein n=1 Tax=Melipona quadrifasciata TaxID=166423 RepID=A0A0N0BBT6_9HYME|nr:hypothetical protein WN51_08149 [Melipona quadrifasciata]